MHSTSLRVLTIAHNAVAASNRARVEALQRLPGFEVRLLTPPWWYEEGRRIEATGAATWHVGRTLFTGNGTRYVYTSASVRSISTWRPDVIDLFEEPFSLVALQTLLLREVFAPRAALVFYSAVNVDRRWRWPYRAVDQLPVRHADAAPAPNADVPRILRSKGFGDKPIAVIPLGVDLERFGAAQPMSLAEIPGPRVGFIGRFEPVKGLDVLLDAFGQLNSAASLVLAGEGSMRGAV